MDPKAPLTPEQKLIRIVENARGDDLERAMIAYGSMTGSELDKPHGQSGQTRRQILDEYKKERELYEKAKALLMTKLG